MLRDEIKDLINQHGLEIWPYLQIRALHKKGYSVQLTEGQIEKEELDKLERSGFIKCEKSGKQIDVLIAQNERYLYQPPETPKYKRKVEVEYIPPLLEELGEIVGYPLDYVKNIGKYRKLLKGLTNQYTNDIIIKVAKFLEKKQPELSMNALLTRKWFKVFKKQMENPSKYEEYKILGRVESANYGEEQPF